MNKVIVFKNFIMVVALAVFASISAITVKASDFNTDIYNSRNSEYSPDPDAEYTENDEDNELIPLLLSVNVGDYLIEAEGNMPKNAYLTVERLSVTDSLDDQINECISDSRNETTKFTATDVFNIDIFDENDQKWQPVDYDESIKITITGIKVDNRTDTISQKYGIYEEVSTEVYRVEDDKVDLMESDTYAGKSSIEFDTDHFTKYVIGSKTVTGAVATFNCGYSGGSPTANVKLYVIQNDDDSSKYDIIVIGSGRMSEYIWCGDLEDGGWFADPDWASYLPNTKQIIIENGVTKLGNYAFACASATEVTLVGGVQEIGNGSFYGCSNLTDVTLPSSLTKIGEKGFYGCESLISLSIPDNVTEIGMYAFDGCSFTELILPSSLTTLGQYAFQCVPLKEIDIPASLTFLDMAVFIHCRSLERVGLSEGLEEISYSAFYNCQSLKSIKIPDSVTTIRGLAFGYCDNMTDIEVGSGVTTLETMTFYAGSTVETRVITENDLVRAYDFSADRRNATISIGSWPMGNSSGEHEVLGWGTLTGDDNIIATLFENPDGTTYTLEFTGSGQMTGVWSYHNLPWYSYADSIKKVTFEDGIENIGQSMIEESPITEVYFPDSVTKIGERAFYYCEKLTSIHFGSGIEEIGDRAFFLANNLFIPTEMTGNCDAKAVLEYAWVDSFRAKQPRYKVLNAANSEIIIEEDFSDNLKIDSINLSGYTGILYLDSECTEELTLPYYSFSDSVFYLDIEAGSIFTSATVVSYPTYSTEFYVYSAEWLSSITKHRDGTEVEIEWFNDMYEPFNVDFTGLTIEFNTADMVKTTLVYTENEYTSENAAGVNGFKVTPLRLYNSDFEFDKSVSNSGDLLNFKCHNEGEDLETEKSILLPGRTVNMYCDIRISKNGLQKTVTIPVTIDVVGRNLDFPLGAELDVSGQVDYSRIADARVRDTYMQIIMRQYSPYKSTVVGILKSDYYDLYKYDEVNETYILLSKDDRLENSTRYKLTKNQDTDPKEILFNNSFIYHDTVLNYYYGGNPTYSFDYRLDVYYDLRDIGLGFKCTHPAVDGSEGTFYYDPIENLGVDLRKYGSVKYDVYGIKIDVSEYSMDETFDFDEIAAKDGFYHYGIKSPGERQIRAYHLFSSADCYRLGNYYVLYIIPTFGATLESSYSIKLPASVELTKGTNGAVGTFDVFTKGNIGSLSTLHVFLNNPDTNKLTGQNTNSKLPFTVSRTKGSDYFYYDTITENYPASGNEYTVSITENDLLNAPVDTYTGNINIEYRIEPRF